ncbi:MAG: type IX secretion system PorP/SprF family membrane protein [Neolewinella sp.]|jgi:type IX secretion system PorP/SprF family membrane protein
MVKSLPLILLGILLSLSLCGQDIHFTQFMNTPLQVSPGLTGVFSGNTRVGATYRSQWNDVPVPFRTFSAYADRKFNCGREKPGYWSAGLAFNHDRAGDSRLTLMNMNGYGSYTQPLSKRALLTVGANLGVGQRGFDTDDLRSDSQYDAGTGLANPSLGLGENFNRTSLIFFDAGIGANLRLQAKQHTKTRSNQNDQEKRNRLDLGFGLHHLNRPNMSFLDDQKVNLPMRFAAYGDGLLQLSEKMDLQLGFQAQLQQAYREYVGIAGVKLHLNQQRGKEFTIMGAMGLCSNNEFTDAWFPMLEFQFRDQLRVSASYNVTVSDFQTATGRNGGFELGVRYIFKKICPIKYCLPFI